MGHLTIGLSLLGRPRPAERPEAALGPTIPAAGTQALGWCVFLEAGGSWALRPRGGPTSGPSGREGAVLWPARAVVPAAHLAHVPHLPGVHPAVTAERLCRGERQVRPAASSDRAGL